MDTEILERAEGLLSRERYTYNECADLMVKFAVAEVARREKEIIAAVDEIDAWAKSPEMFTEEVLNYFQGLRLR